MKKLFNRKFNKFVYEIFAGDYVVTREKMVLISTILGSCIAVCMFDSQKKIVGMNHFMLPDSIKLKNLIINEDTRYGVYAMEIMINEMMKLGADRRNLQAKVFGGGHVIDTVLSKVATSNIDFALSYLELEKIPVVSKDVGGRGGRKIILVPETFEVYLKRIDTTQNTLQHDKKFLQKVRNQRLKDSELTYFD